MGGIRDNKIGEIGSSNAIKQFNILLLFRLLNMIYVSGWIDILVHHEYLDLRSGQFGLRVMDTLPATNSTVYRYVL